MHSTNVFIDTTDEEGFECLYKSFEKQKKSMSETDKTAMQQLLDKTNKIESSKTPRMME